MPSYKTPSNLQKQRWLLVSGKGHDLSLYRETDHSKETEENMKGIFFLELELLQDVFDPQAWKWWS